MPKKQTEQPKCDRAVRLRSIARIAQHNPAQRALRMMSEKERIAFARSAHMKHVWQKRRQDSHGALEEFDPDAVNFDADEAHQLPDSLA